MSAIDSLGRRIYDLGWKAALPLLRRNERLAHGWEERVLDKPLPPADLWIHAASGGEAYLVSHLLNGYEPSAPLQVLATTNTHQGMEILTVLEQRLFKNKVEISLLPAYFPFDAPSIMSRAVDMVRPKAAVLVEGELWPGMLHALKRSGIPTALINGRMTPSSLARYLLRPSFWRSLRPDRIQAVSENDAQRFRILFGPEGVRAVGNIKFDRIRSEPPPPSGDNPLSRLVDPNGEFLVLGSVRRQEEVEVLNLVARVSRDRPEAVIGLFPRHMERVDAWMERLKAQGLACARRSGLDSPASPGTVVVWDRFGELSQAYGLCRAAFVGGSLAPLGGQNFLEPLTCGVVPVIGPHWRNFAWVGASIVEMGLVRETPGWEEAARELSLLAKAPPDPEEIRARALEYFRSREGGTRAARELVAELAEND